MCDPLVFRGSYMREVLASARKAEREMFEEAASIDDYNYYVGYVRCRRIKKGLAEKWKGWPTELREELRELREYQIRRAREERAGKVLNVLFFQIDQSIV